MVLMITSIMENQGVIDNFLIQGYTLFPTLIDNFSE
jgi:hypothetical protein